MQISLAWDYDAILLVPVAGETLPDVEKFEIWTWDAASNTRLVKVAETSTIPTDAVPFTFRMPMSQTVQGTAQLSVWAVSPDFGGTIGRIYSVAPASISVAVRPPNVQNLRAL